MKFKIQYKTKVSPPQGLRHIYQRFLVWLGLCFAATPVLAGLPRAPQIPGENSGDYIKVGVSAADEGLSAFLTLVFVGCILGYCTMVFFLIRHAKEKHEWGPMIKGSGIGLVALVIVLILLNVGKRALGTS